MNQPRFGVREFELEEKILRQAVVVDRPRLALGYLSVDMGLGVLCEKDKIAVHWFVAGGASVGGHT